MVNLNLRKEIEHVEMMVADQKEISHAHYGELVRLRDASYALDRDCEQLRKTYNVLRADLENNDQRLLTMQSLLANKEDNLQAALVKLADAHAATQDLKYALNKLDGELGYFESLNE